MYKKIFKRPVDIVCALLAITVFSWLYILIAVLVRVKLGSPVLFTQDRIGLNEKVIKLYKFRTMTDEKDENGELLPDNKRLTKFGKLLRSTSLDEIPQAFNILKGDMSVVGPRALLTEYVPYYTDYEKQKHLVRPGLTQPEVLFHDVIPTWENQFKYEVDYSKNITFFGDVKIILYTLIGVVSRHNKDYGSYNREKLSDLRKTIKTN